MVIADEKHDGIYKKGFSDGFTHAKAELLNVLFPPTLDATPPTRKSISVEGHRDLIQILLKMHGKVDAFFHLVDTDDTTEALFILIEDELSHIKNIIEDDFE